ncbi:Tyrosine-protein phosphatase domain-containing protein [Trichostrongylus colubriformis]|uniref:Tyrosine-protein phosphatase domain-containing protein n=1 Tax=Trichostrongylus colubriformis TaxID=6319 RepID=A0AAN8FVC2_TRICO
MDMRTSTKFDTNSVGSSIEFHDAIIDEGFEDDGRKASVEAQIFESRNKSSILERIIHYFTDRALLKRLEAYEDSELKTFIAQKLFKVDGILCDEQTRLELIQNMVVQSGSFELDETDLVRKYGEEMTGWLKDRLVPTISECSSVLYNAASHFNRLKSRDPLHNWYRQPEEVSAQIAARISRFAEQMSDRVKWSVLIEPGKFNCHLMDFTAEFNRLESFFSVNELSPEEASQTAFNSNYLTKARSKLIPCCDISRVRLQDDGTPQMNRAQLIGEIFAGEHTTDITSEQGTYGTPDFIHANYVRGGPLLNTFICTQAPLPNTQADFWRMVYQEKSRFIIMLCSAMDKHSLGPLDHSPSYNCQYYWPRSVGESSRYGSLIVRNVRVDGTVDPLFNVTHLEVQPADSNNDADILHVEHWQWDWQNMCDVHWPFRVLRKARLQKTPTIVQCLDGCDRSGTLVTIETVLMQFLRGSPLDDDTVLLSALFVRLQRRLAVSSSLHYLFIYRTVLHWIAPYVTSVYQRFALGLSWTGKYTSILRVEKEQASKTLLERSQRRLYSSLISFSPL